MANIAETIKSDLAAAIENDKLVLPTLPEVALQVREIAESEDSSIADLVKAISNDTALSARIIRVCNSPLFRGSRAIENLNMAVSRLGMAYTSNLAMGLAMEQMFQATSEMIDTRLRANLADQHRSGRYVLCPGTALQQTESRSGDAGGAGASDWCVTDSALRGRPRYPDQ